MDKQPKLIPGEVLQKWRVLLDRYLEDPQPGRMAREDLEEIRDDMLKFQGS